MGAMASEANAPDDRPTPPAAGDDGDPSDTTESTGSVATSGDEVDFSPEKREMYQAIRSDVDVTEAFLELVDNAIDNWEKVSGKTDPVTVEIFTRTNEDGEQEVIIRDDTGGVPRDSLEMLFAVGKSAKDDIDGSVGAYGVGLKKAILRLADDATIATREASADSGYGFTVDKGWLSTDSWKRPVEEFELDPGVTEIRLRSLNFQSSDLKERLQSPLETTYEIFLGGGPRPDVQDYDFEIRLESEMLDAGDDVNWAYPPFDNLHPRQFRNKEFDSAEISEPVRVHVTAGVLQTADADASGTDVFIQNRKVHDGAKNEQGGYGLTRYMGSFRDSQHKRLKLIVEIETDGDAAQLPWSSSKNTIDLDHSLSEQIFNWVARIGKGYYKATYNSVPQTVLRPYGVGCRHSHTGEIGSEYIDASGRKKITSKVSPAARFPEAKQIASTAEAHAKLGIKVPDAIPDEWGPAYEEHWDDQFDRQHRDYYDDVGVHPVTLSTDPGVSPSAVDGKIDQIDGWAQDDAARGERYVDLEAWQEPRYMATLRKHLSATTDEDDLTEITERPTTATATPTGDDSDDGVAGDTSGDDGSSPLSDGDDSDGVETSDAGSETDASGDGDADDGPSIVDDPDGDRPVSPAAEGAAEDGRTEHLISITDDQMTTLNEVLDLSEDFDECPPAERGDEIAQKCERLRAVFRAANEATASGD